jgi:lactam utilization protein B
MDLLFELPGKVRLEKDGRRKVYAAQWQTLCGPHYRAACEALLADARANGIRVYVSDPHVATDIQNPEDLRFAAEVVHELVSLGCRLFLVVTPQSAVTKLATNRMGKVVDAFGVKRLLVPTLGEALELARDHQDPN